MKQLRFNDAVIRNLVIRTSGPVTEPSPMMKAREDRRAAREDNDTRRRGDRDESSDAEVSAVEA